MNLPEIKRKSAEPDAFNFQRLKSEGLRLLQELGGERWTDFNLHDPGVTILEQCCYALTDLAYRTGFPTVDHLVDRDGRIDQQRMALHRAEDVFPCHAATISDYRKLIFCLVPEIDNVWVSLLRNRLPRGLYRIVIRPGSMVVPADLPALCQKVRLVYLANRNLCEDIEELEVASEEECRMEGSVEIGGDRDPAEILAEIYHVCELKIDGGLPMHHFDELAGKGLPLDEIFRGPFTGHAFILDAELDGKEGGGTISDLLTTVKGIPGVRHVGRLAITRKGSGGGREYVESWVQESALRLVAPKDEMPALTIIRNGKKVAIRFQDFRIRYEELRLRRRALRVNLLDGTPLAPAPTGRFRELGSYLSIQAQFPDLYGINERGIPTSAPDEDKGRAAQLKAYLLFFDQVMADFSANLHNLRHLFSLETEPPRSYRTSVVENPGFPGLEMIYPPHPDRVLDSLMQEHDPYADRKSRLLDYLLALYGEVFPGEQYLRFNVYTELQEREMALLQQKAAFLRAIVPLSRDRGRAFDYAKPSGDGNVSGLQRRVALLLGFVEEEHSLTSTLSGLGLKIGPSAAKPLHGIDETKLELVPLRTVPAPPMLAELTRELSEVIGEALTPELLRWGIDPDALALLSAAHGERRALLFKPDGDEWRKLGLFPDREEGVRAANRLRRFLIELNRASEGMYIVEHLLLRGREEHETREGEDLLSFRITVIFPAWTARCSDPEFRRYAEDTVRGNCPPYIEPLFLWLAFEDMVAFEGLRGEWLEAKSGAASGPEVDAAAGRLLARLSELQEQSGGRGGGK